MALKVGANRVVRGARFSHPCGDPGLDADGERALRLALVRKAVLALATEVAGPTLFEVTE